MLLRFVSNAGVSPYTVGTLLVTGSFNAAWSQTAAGFVNDALNKATPNQYDRLMDALENAALNPASSGAGSIVGKIFNLPNTVIGVAYGLLGGFIDGIVYVGSFGQINLGFGIEFANNAIEFVNHPISMLMGGAITLGNTISYGGPVDFPVSTSIPGLSVPAYQHEFWHTIQGEILGPFDLPANIVGGLASVIGNLLGISQPGPGGSSWHGGPNFMEQGPLSYPPRAQP